MNKLKIPPKYTGYRKNANIVNKLKELDIGEKETFPKDAWGTLHGCASCAGIKITTRSLGSEKEVTAWRIE